MKRLRIFAICLLFRSSYPIVALGQEVAQKANQKASELGTCRPAVNHPPNELCSTDSQPPHKHRRSSRSAGAKAGKIVVHDGGAADSSPHFFPSVSGQQATQQLENTKRLLVSTDLSLKKLEGRKLEAGQQEAISQIKTYAEQAKAAISAGDFERANKLAVKANLLSTEMAGH